MIIRVENVASHKTLVIPIWISVLQQPNSKLARLTILGTQLEQPTFPSAATSALHSAAPLGATCLGGHEITQHATLGAPLA
jgi:hypothetical protein